MRIKVPIANYLSSQNEDLYNNLKDECRIELFREQPIPEGANRFLWNCISQVDEFTIVYYEDIDSNAYFTHELFHIDLIRRGFTDNTQLILYARASENTTDTIAQIFDTVTIPHINNIFGHYRFYDEFIGRGYKPQEFTSDFGDPVQLEPMFARVNANLGKKQLPNDSIQAFIAYYYLVQDNRNSSKKGEYEKLLDFLRAKNPDLYVVLENNWKWWQKSNQLNNHEVITSLFHQTNDWYNSL